MPVLRALLVLILLCSAASHAARPTYTYAGVGYTRDDFSGDFDCVQDGLYLEGSFSLNEHLFVGARHVDVTSDDYACGSTTFRLQGGFRGDWGRSSSMYALASAVVRDSGDDTDPGAGAEVGIRSIWTHGLETKLFAGYEKVHNFEETSVGVGINYWLGHRFSFTAELALSDEEKTGAAVGLRVNF